MWTFGWTWKLGWISLGVVIAALGGPTSAVWADERVVEPFDRARLIEHARRLAEQRYELVEIPAESPLSKLGYDQYRAIRFPRSSAIWKSQDRGFVLDLLPPGFLFRTPVRLNLVSAGVARSVLFSSDLFEYGLDTESVRELLAPNYSGFRVAYPINREDVFDEFLVFQGASYFRAVGRENRYGVSARGLAIDTAAQGGEEFPVFREFWVERPRRGAQSVRIHALLDSPSVTGAYVFTATPGLPTVIDVEVALFARRELQSVGLAPLTSMFLFDATNARRFDDYRPAVADSDGLAIAMGNGERIWRPLANPRLLQVSSFSGDGVRGFGLCQRKRRFEDFEDDEARYELRPSLWIEPRGDWGAGRVELVEIPTLQEIHDNIVAYFKPEKRLARGERLDFGYRMFWGNHAPREAALARVVATRVGRVGDSGARRFVVDFAAASVPSDLRIVLTSSSGRVRESHGSEVAATGAYRVAFEFEPEGSDPAELRLVLLKKDGESWAETWLYRWTR